MYGRHRIEKLDTIGIGADEVNQTSAYLRRTWGRMAIMSCNEKPLPATRRRRNTIYSTEDGKLILFITRANLKEDHGRPRGPSSDFLIDSVGALYLQYN